MDTSSMKECLSKRLVRLGVLLLLLGLLSGLLIPVLANPRMGLTSHVEGVMSGMLLIIMGLVWPRLRLSNRAMMVTSWLLIYGTYANWANPLLAAAWAAGGTMMPMASRGHLRKRWSLASFQFPLSLLCLQESPTCCGGSAERINKGHS